MTNCIEEAWVRDLDYSQCLDFAERLNDRPPTEQEFKAGCMYLQYEMENFFRKQNIVNSDDEELKEFI